MAANSIITPDPSGEIHRSRLAATDAEILALGAEFDTLNTAVEAECERADDLQESAPDNAETRDAAWTIRDGCRPLTARCHAILTELRDRPASTVPGMAVKARTLLKWFFGEVPDDHNEGRVAWSLARDVIRLAEREDDSTADAALLAACAEFEALEMGYIGLFYGPARIENDQERMAADSASGRPERQAALLEVITDTAATTPDGLRAKARCAAAETIEIVADEDTPIGRIGSSLIRDLVGDFDPIAIAKGEAA